MVGASMKVEVIGAREVRRRLAEFGIDDVTNVAVQASLPWSFSVRMALPPDANVRPKRCGLRAGSRILDAAASGFPAGAKEMSLA